MSLWRIFLKSSHGTKISSVPYISTSVLRPEWRTWAATALLQCVELSVSLWAMGGHSRSRKQHLHGIETEQECELHLQLGITDTTCSHILPEEYDYLPEACHKRSYSNLSYPSASLHLVHRLKYVRKDKQKVSEQSDYRENERKWRRKKRIRVAALQK